MHHLPGRVLEEVHHGGIGTGGLGSCLGLGGVEEEGVKEEEEAWLQQHSGLKHSVSRGQHGRKICPIYIYIYAAAARLVPVAWCVCVGLELEARGGHVHINFPYGDCEIAMVSKAFAFTVTPHTCTQPHTYAQKGRQADKTTFALFNFLLLLLFFPCLRPSTRPSRDPA